MHLQFGSKTDTHTFKCSIILTINCLIHILAPLNMHLSRPRVLKGANIIYPPFVIIKFIYSYHQKFSRKYNLHFR